MKESVEPSAKNVTHSFVLSSVASKHCVPILADEIYSDMVSSGDMPSRSYRFFFFFSQVGLALCSTNETHFFDHNDRGGCAVFGGICPGL